MIIEYMNNLYTTYRKVGRAGIKIPIDYTILYGLVNDFYSIKNVKFFMTNGTELIIFPIERFSEYFNIQAFYRRKTADHQSLMKITIILKLLMV